MSDVICVCNPWIHRPLGGGASESTASYLECVCVCHILFLRVLSVLGFVKAGDQAGYIVAWSTKLAMYPRIWKWDVISTYLLKFELLTSSSAAVCLRGVCMIFP